MSDEETPPPTPEESNFICWNLWGAVEELISQAKTSFQKKQRWGAPGVPGRRMSLRSLPEEKEEIYQEEGKLEREPASKGTTIP